MAATESKIELSDLTPTEAKMWAVLSDNRAHTREEMHACLWDEEGSLNNIQMHVSRLRPKVARIGFEIIVQLRGFQRLYRRIPLVS